MLFNSYAFIAAFLPVVLLSFFWCSHKFGPRGGVVLLVIASVGFYGYWNVANIPILIGSVLFNFFLANKIAADRRKRWLTVGLGFNFVLLVYYKYAVFFLSVLTSAFAFETVHLEIGAMPLGISFFTFTQTAFLIDMYRGEKKETGFWEYLLFVTFFPHLISGPILYHKDILPQFYDRNNFVFSHENFSRGITLFTLGLFKKVVVADSLIEWVAMAFSRPGDLTFFEAWLGALAYAFQLYYDFSGYSDMAVGLGWMLNIRLPINFNSPYRATSMTQFWNCWHMTLITFLNQYLFTALGGFRVGYWRAMLNIMITITLAGLWHGAGWTFIGYGFLCGSYLVINYSWRKFGWFSLPRFFSWLLVFGSIVVAATVFRSADLTAARQILAAMFGFKGVLFPAGMFESISVLNGFGFLFGEWKVFTYDLGAIVFCIAVLIVSIHVVPNTNELMKVFVPNRKWAVVTAIVGMISLLHLHRVTEFLYFQF